MTVDGSFTTPIDPGDLKWLTRVDPEEPMALSKNEVGKAQAEMAQLLEADQSTRPSFGPFTLTKDGLFDSSETEPCDGGPACTPPVKLCGPFQVMAQTRDTQNSSWGLLIRWQDQDGHPHEENIPRELAFGEGNDLAKMLVRGGLQVAREARRRKKLVEYFATVTVPTRARVVDRIGWHGSVFVLPDRTFGEDKAGEHVLLARSLDHNFRVSGTLESWQAEIGVPSQGNSRLVFAISCAFAGPLLERLGAESGGFNFFGPSSKGKTTCAVVAGSVWGGDRYLETWRATSNGLESTAVAHNDALLVLDEQGQALAHELSEVAYMLANGIDKIRSSRTLDTQPRRRWRLVFLSTGEGTLANKLLESGKKSKPGQDVRIVDIPLNPDGFDQAFESWSGYESSQAFADHLKEASAQYFGSPIRGYLDQLSQVSQEELPEIKVRIRDWLHANVPQEADSQVQRVAERFALVAAAGELAAAWGILPWEDEHAEWAVATCFKSWLAYRGGIGSGEHLKGIQSILEFIDRHGQSRFAEWGVAGLKIDDMAGWSVKNKDEGAETYTTDYLFSPSGWKEACAGFDPKVVARAMFDAGMLEGSLKGGKFKAQKKVRFGRMTRGLYSVRGDGISAYQNRMSGLPSVVPMMVDGEGTKNKHVG